jgi:hypothetical protein
MRPLFEEFFRVLLKMLGTEFLGYFSTVVLWFHDICEGKEGSKVLVIPSLFFSPVRTASIRLALRMKPLETDP